MPMSRPLHVPTLTEVVEMPAATDQQVVEAGGAVIDESPVLAAVDLSDVPVLDDVPEVAMPQVEPAPVQAPAPEVNEAQLAQKILVDVQKQIDSMLEFRLRESMQPLLSQFIETLMEDLRDELSRTMRDVVTRSVAQEMAKWRNREKT